MTLNAYAVGRSIVAAVCAEDAIAVMERHEAPGRWRLADVTELAGSALDARVDDSSPETVREAIERFAQLEPRSRLDAARTGTGHLIRWDYPSA